MSRDTSLPNYGSDFHDGDPYPKQPKRLRPERIQVHPLVGTLMQTLLQYPENCQLFCQDIDNSVGPLQMMLSHRHNHKMKSSVRLSGIARHDATMKQFPVETYPTNEVEITESDTPEYYRRPDMFHLGFSVFQFKMIEDEQTHMRIAQPVQVRDRMTLYQCSVGKPQRTCASHILGLESLLHSVHMGCYFATVMPKKWMGRDMSYLRWWQNNAAEVARIRLPNGSVQWDSGMEGSELQDFDNAWEFLLYFRPYQDEVETATRSAKQGPKLQWAGFRYSPFVLPLDNWNPKAIDKVTEGFRRHDWWKNSIKLWKKMLELHPSDNTFGRTTGYPCGLPNQENMWFFEPDVSKNNTIRIVDVEADSIRDPDGTQKEKRMLDKMKKIPYAVRIKATRSKIKLTAMNPGMLAATNSLLHEMMISKGFTTEKDDEGDMQSYPRFMEILRRPLSEVSDKLCESLRSHGLEPCMTAIDYKQMQKRSRWLSIQLAPIERTVLIQKGKLIKTNGNGVSSGNGSSSSSGNGGSNSLTDWTVGDDVEVTPDMLKPVAVSDLRKRLLSMFVEGGGATTVEGEVWETLYDDTGIKAAFPEVYNLWMSRARKMKMDRMGSLGLYESFQMDDVVMHATKQSILNGNVMGLGKTRELLFAALLRGTMKTLIICPSKLIGNWQDEIDNTIIPYIQSVRRNWMGQIIPAMKANVIEYASDCLPNKLALFNIISFDKLKAVPRDGRFLKCPKCGLVTYTPYYDTPNASKYLCTGKECAEAHAEWKERCSARSEETGALMYRKVKVEISTGKKVHWNPEHESRANIPECSTTVVDTRPQRPGRDAMIAQTTAYDKYTKEYLGMEKKTIVLDSGDSMEIELPKYTSTRRKNHVAWTLSDILRWKFNHIIADEILYAANEDSQRTNALDHMCGRTRWVATGTPMKGMPQSMLPYLNWTFDRDVFPDYRRFHRGGKARFLKKYKTEVYVGGIEVQGEVVGGKPKQVPRINNPELFQAELSPLMLRHTRNEPAVVRNIPRKRLETQNLSVPMDDYHRAYYQKWLDEFAMWWKTMKAEEEGKETQEGQLLTKLGYLINASTNPHFMLEGIAKSKDTTMKAWASKIGPYRGPITSKMLMAQEITRMAIEKQDKTIFFSTRTRNLDMMNAWCEKNKLNSVIVDGRSDLKIQKGSDRSQRHMIVEKFRHQAYHLMCGGLTALAEGMNIPEANHCIVNDYSWEPKDVLQAVGRVIRPQQTKTIYQYFLMHTGTIDEYMCALTYLKGRSHEEGIDYMEFDDFGVDVIPDIHQYADCIVGGEDDQQKFKQRMWLAVEHVRREGAEEGDEGGEE